MARPLTVDLTGQTIGRLYISGRAPNRPTNKKVYWTYVCECGRTGEAQTFDILMGKTRSCGCYREERQREIHSKSQRN